MAEETTFGDKDSNDKLVSKCSQMHSMLVKESMAFRQAHAKSPKSQKNDEIGLSLQNNTAKLENTVVERASSIPAMKALLGAAAKSFKKASQARAAIVV